MKVRRCESSACFDEAGVGVPTGRVSVATLIERGATFVVLVACLLATAVLAAAERPNVVMIIPDDQTYSDFGFMGNDLVQTPHLDKLASQSTVFVNGYVPTSVCSPSLATLLTGLYPHQSGIHYNHPPPGNKAFANMPNAQTYVAKRTDSFELIKSVKTLPRLLAASAH